MVLGTDAAFGLRTCRLHALLLFSTNATFRIQFAQNAATANKTARICQGSVLRYRRLR
jgi:hypothetical protein